MRQPKVEIMPSGHFVARSSDFIIYSVEAKNIDAVVKTFGPCTRLSVMTRSRLTCLCSYETGGYCWWSDFLQSSRNGSVREASP